MYKPLCLFIWIYGIYAALALLFPYFQKPLQPNILKDTAKQAADVGGLISLIWFVGRAIRLLDLELSKRAKSPESRVDDLQAALIGKTLRWLIIITGCVLVFQYLTGIAAAPVIASLGIGGLAVALAAKDSLSNLFGTVTIMFDQPFKVGDRIKMDGFDGFVETVGYRSTRLRLWNGNQVTVPNQKITSSNVENFARRPHIWWKTDITITYDTPPDKVDKAVELIEEIIRKDPDTSRAWPPWVFFDGFNDWSLNLRVLAWFNSPGKEPGQFDYYTWRQRICRQILRKFEQEGIQFAFPTQTTYLARDDKRDLQIQMIMGRGPDADNEPQ
jgi:MscS family membrane protein